MEEPAIEVSTSTTSRNIRVIVPLGHGEYIFKDPDMQEVIRRMSQKILYLENRVHSVEAENSDLLLLCAKALGEGEQR